MKKFLCLLLCCMMLVPVLASCSKAPEYAEIEGRFRELVEASAEINHILFGTGLATYERVVDPRSSTKLFTDEKTGAQYHYYQIEDSEKGEIIAFRQAYTTKIHEEGTNKYFYYEALDPTYGKILVINSVDTAEDICLQILTAPKEDVEPYYTHSEDGWYGYLLENFSYQKDEYAYVEAENEPRAGAEPYYRNEAKGRYYYLLSDYTEPTYESFYDEDDLSDYDYVRLDEKYRSVEEIKEAAAKVYSAEYLESIYETMFVGTAAADSSVRGQTARYIEYADEDGAISLRKSNTVKPLITETRVYDFSTAKMVRPSNGKYVNITVDSYLPSKPDEILNVRLSMILQDGVWMLDSATY